VNWWIAAAPVRVFASGGLRFYGAENAAARGLGLRPERGIVATGDPFVTDDPPLGRVAGFADGVKAVSVGIAGNLSLETGLPVRIADLDLGA